MNKYIVFACFLILLLVPSLAMPQSSTDTSNHGSPPIHLRSLYDTYVKRPSSVGPLYEIAKSESPAAVAETPKTEAEKEETKTAAPAETKASAETTPAAEAKAATETTPAADAGKDAPPKPAIEEEIETLKARLADLEKRLEENAAAAASAPP